LRVGLLVQRLPREAGIEIGGKIGNQAAAEVLNDAGVRELRERASQPGEPNAAVLPTPIKMPSTLAADARARPRLRIIIIPTEVAEWTVHSP
jgi:hypothetical protein